MMKVLIGTHKTVFNDNVAVNYRYKTLIQPFTTWKKVVNLSKKVPLALLYLEKNIKINGVHTICI